MRGFLREAPGNKGLPAIPGRSTAEEGIEEQENGGETEVQQARPRRIRCDRDRRPGGLHGRLHQHEAGPAASSLQKGIYILEKQ